MPTSISSSGVPKGFGQPSPSSKVYTISSSVNKLSSSEKNIILDIQQDSEIKVFYFKGQSLEIRGSHRLKIKELHVTDEFNSFSATNNVEIEIFKVVKIRGISRLFKKNKFNISLLKDLPAGNYVIEGVFLDDKVEVDLNDKNKTLILNNIRGTKEITIKNCKVSLKDLKDLGKLHLENIGILTKTFFNNVPSKAGLLIYYIDFPNLRELSIKNVQDISTLTVKGRDENSKIQVEYDSFNNLKTLVLENVDLGNNKIVVDTNSSLEKLKLNNTNVEITLKKEIGLEGGVDKLTCENIALDLNKIPNVEELSLKGVKLGTYESNGLFNSNKELRIDKTMSGKFSNLKKLTIEALDLDGVYLYFPNNKVEFSFDKLPSNYFELFNVKLNSLIVDQKDNLNTLSLLNVDIDGELSVKKELNLYLNIINVKKLTISDAKIKSNNNMLVESFLINKTTFPNIKEVYLSNPKYVKNIEICDVKLDFSIDGTKDVEVESIFLHNVEINKNLVVKFKDKHVKRSLKIYEAEGINVLRISNVSSVILDHIPRTVEYLSLLDVDDLSVIEIPELKNNFGNIKHLANRNLLYIDCKQLTDLKKVNLGISNLHTLVVKGTGNMPIVDLSHHFDKLELLSIDSVVFNTPLSFDNFPNVKYIHIFGKDRNNIIKLRENISKIRSTIKELALNNVEFVSTAYVPYSEFNIDNFQNLSKLTIGFISQLRKLVLRGINSANPIQLQLDLSKSQSYLKSLTLENVELDKLELDSFPSLNEVILNSVSNLQTISIKGTDPTHPINLQLDFDSIKNSLQSLTLANIRLSEDITFIDFGELKVINLSNLMKEGNAHLFLKVISNIVEEINLTGLNINKLYIECTKLSKITIGDFAYLSDLHIVGKGGNSPSLLLFYVNDIIKTTLEKVFIKNAKIEIKQGNQKAGFEAFIKISDLHLDNVSLSRLVLKSNRINKVVITSIYGLETFVVKNRGVFPVRLQLNLNGARSSIQTLTLENVNIGTFSSKGNFAPSQLLIKDFTQLQTLSIKGDPKNPIQLQLDLSKSQSSLKSLTLENVNIDKLDLKSLTNLKNLSLSNLSLKELTIENLPLTNINLTSISDLQTLSIKGTDPSNPIQLQLDLDSIKTSIHNLTLDKVNIGTFDPSGSFVLSKELKIEGYKRLEKLALSNMLSIEELSIIGEKPIKIFLAEFNNINTLVLDNVLIYKDIDFSKKDNLSEKINISVQDNPPNKYKFGKDEVREFYALSFPNLSNLTLRRVHNITALAISGKGNNYIQLKDSNFDSLLSTLEYFRIHNVNAEFLISEKKFEKLKYVYIENCNITTLSILKEFPYKSTRSPVGLYLSKDTDIKNVHLFYVEKKEFVNYGFEKAVFEAMNINRFIIAKEVNNNFYKIDNTNFKEIFFNGVVIDKLIVKVDDDKELKLTLRSCRIDEAQFNGKKLEVYSDRTTIKNINRVIDSHLRMIVHNRATLLKVKRAINSLIK